MVGSEKCQALHSLIRIVVCTGVRKQCGRNFGSEVTKWLFVFFYIVQTRSMVLLFLSLQKLKKNKQTKKQQNICLVWNFSKILPCFHMPNFHSDLYKGIFFIF